MEHGPAASFLTSLPCSLSLPLVGQRVLWQLWQAALLLVFPIPTAAEDMTTDYCVGSHPELVNGMIDQYRQYVQPLGQEEQDNNGFELTM